MDSNTSDIPHIVSIQSGTENTLFLTDDGQVFISKYETYEITDVEYGLWVVSDPSRMPHVETYQNAHLKELTFEKLDLTDIESIWTNGENYFCAVDREGGHYRIKIKDNEVTQVYQGLIPLSVDKKTYMQKQYEQESGKSVKRQKVHDGGIKVEIKKKLCSICLCLCVGLTACGTTSTEGRSRSAVPETEQNIREEDISAETTEEDIPQEDNFIELFDSQRPYIQLLAEGEEDLSEADRAEFLAAFGFEDSEPFYVHTEEDGYPFMELYFDEEHEVGCGIRYGENVSGNVICGFAFDHCLEVSWHERDPFSVLSVYGITGETSVTDYQENYEYDEEGRLISFRSTGTPTDIDGEEWKNTPIIEIDFTVGTGRNSFGLL